MSISKMFIILSKKMKNGEFNYLDADYTEFNF